jgi:predicted MFS family arabinose efflux permease
LLQNAAEGPARAFFNVYLDRGLGVATDQIGLIIGFAQLLPVATALLAVRLLARYGAALTLALASLGACLAYLPLAGVAAWVPAALGFMGVMMMAAIHVSARGVFSQEVVIPRWRTTTSAILTIGMALGWASTAAGGGFVIASFGFGALFAISAGLAAGAAALAWSAYRMRAGRAAVALTSMPSPSSR